MHSSDLTQAGSSARLPQAKAAAPSAGIARQPGPLPDLSEPRGQWFICLPGVGILATGQLSVIDHASMSSLSEMLPPPSVSQRERNVHTVPYGRYKRYFSKQSASGGIETVTKVIERLQRSCVRCRDCTASSTRWLLLRVRRAVLSSTPIQHLRK